jgi:hypothetical protein
MHARPSRKTDLRSTAAVRFEPTPWLGLSLMLSFGVDSYPNPFGMVELGVSFFIPL